MQLKWDWDDKVNEVLKWRSPVQLLLLLKPQRSQRMSGFQVVKVRTEFQACLTFESFFFQKSACVNGRRRTIRAQAVKCYAKNSQLVTSCAIAWGASKQQKKKAKISPTIFFKCYLWFLASLILMLKLPWSIYLIAYYYYMEKKAQRGLLLLTFCLPTETCLLTIYQVYFDWTHMTWKVNEAFFLLLWKLSARTESCRSRAKKDWKSL